MWFSQICKVFFYEPLNPPRFLAHVWNEINKSYHPCLILYVNFVEINSLKCMILHYHRTHGILTLVFTLVIRLLVFCHVCSGFTSSWIVAASPVNILWNADLNSPRPGLPVGSWEQPRPTKSFKSSGKLSGISGLSFSIFANQTISKFPGYGSTQLKISNRMMLKL